MLTLDKGQIKTTVCGLVVHKFNTTEYSTTPLEKSISLWTLCQHSLNTVQGDDRHGERKKFSWTRESKYSNRSSAISNNFTTNFVCKYTMFLSFQMRMVMSTFPR